MAPMRKGPACANSFGASPSFSYREQICSARARVVSPAAFRVAERPVLLKSSNPNSSSRRLIWLLTADCVRPIRSPAAENVP